MTEQQNPEKRMVLDSGRDVPRWVYDAVYRLIMNFYPSMRAGHSYTLQTICGNEFWNKKNKKLPVWAGYCAAHMVRNHIVPLDVDRANRKSTKMYIKR